MAKETKNSTAQYKLTIDNLPGYFLITALIASLFGLYIVMERFLTVIIMAGLITVAFYPVYKKILQKLKNRSSLASIISCILVFLIIVLPISLLILLLAREAYDTYNIIQAKINSGELDNMFNWFQGPFLTDLQNRLRPVIDLNSIDIKTTISETAKAVSGFLVTQSANFIKSITTVMIDFVVLIFALYYFFKDGEHFKEKLMQYVPLPSKYEKKIFAKLEGMIGAIAYGLLLTALVQGILAGFGFWIAGISNPIFWGAVTSFFALIPLVGTGVVWGPAGLILIFSGHIGWGIFILLWGIFLVGLVDNFLKPYLIGERAHTYPLLTFLSIFGGIFAFKLKGIIFGPVIMILALTLLYIYKLEYKPIIKK